MVTETDIANVALIMVGEAKINTLTDNKKGARLAKSLYTVSRDEAFDMPVDWKFATARRELSQLAVTPASGYDFQYALPTDVRRVIAQVEEDNDDIQFKWRREIFGDVAVLLTNETTAFIKYIVLITDTSLYPAWFVRLIYLNMAVKLAQPLKQDDKKVQQFAQLLELAMIDAEQSNGMEDVNVNQDQRRDDTGNMDVLDAAQRELDSGLLVNRII